MITDNFEMQFHQDGKTFELFRYDCFSTFTDVSKISCTRNADIKNLGSKIVDFSIGRWGSFYQFALVCEKDLFEVRFYDFAEFFQYSFSADKGLGEIKDIEILDNQLFIL